MEFPKDLRYTKEHEWARLDGANVTIGITAFAVEQLGDITLVDLPQVDAQVTAEESLGTIESVKSVSDIFAPVSGTVTAINEQLEDRPELVNEAPYGDGWLVKIALEDRSAYDALLDSVAYAKLVAAEQ